MPDKFEIPIAVTADTAGAQQTAQALQGVGNAADAVNKKPVAPETSGLQKQAAGLQTAITLLRATGASTEELEKKLEQVNREMSRVDLTNQIAQIKAAGGNASDLEAALRKAGETSQNSFGKAGAAGKEFGNTVKEGAHAEHLFLMLTGQAEFSLRGFVKGIKAVSAALMENPFALAAVALAAISALVIKLASDHHAAAAKIKEDQEAIQEVVETSRDSFRKLNQTQVNFDESREAARGLSVAYENARNAAEKLQAAQDKMADAQTRKELADLNLEKLKAIREVKAQQLSPDDEKKQVQNIEDEYGEKELGVRNKQADRKAQRELGTAVAQLSKTDNELRLNRNSQRNLTLDHSNQMDELSDDREKLESQFKSWGLQRDDRAEEGKEYAGGQKMADLQKQATAKGNSPEKQRAQLMLRELAKYQELPKLQREAEENYRKALRELQEKGVNLQGEQTAAKVDVDAAQVNLSAVRGETQGASTADATKREEHQRDQSKRDALRDNEEQSKSLQTDIGALEEAQRAEGEANPKFVEDLRIITEKKMALLDLGLARKELEGTATDEDRRAVDVGKGKLASEYQRTAGTAQQKAAKADERESANAFQQWQQEQTIRKGGPDAAKAALELLKKTGDTGTGHLQELAKAQEQAGAVQADLLRGMVANQQSLATQLSQLRSVVSNIQAK